MKILLPFNQGWLYARGEHDERVPDSAFEPITLPHTNITLPHNGFDNGDYQFVSTYRKRFKLPEPQRGRRVYLDFEGVMTSCAVTLNGHHLGEHDGGYTPFTLDVTDHIHRGENLLTVRVDSSENPDIPPNGGVVDYLTFGGIYREARIRMIEPFHMADDLFARTLDVMKAYPRLEVDVTVRNMSAFKQTRRLEVYFSGRKDPNDRMITLEAGQEQRMTIRVDSSLTHDIERWSLTHPALYQLELKLFEEDREADWKRKRVGFREAVFRKDGFYLNGEHIKLFGLNRHQTYPYIGGAAPARLQRKDADILKDELGCNMVRTSHYPQAVQFINRCDEIGLLVFEEIPGWQWIGDSDWKALALRDLESMIIRDRNHPSVVLWGVRINESQDDEALYRATNELAHKLDPTRQTGGVRFFQTSQFLEDVFTYNDFSDGVEAPLHTPHLISEFNGHMFPTKSFDSEERQVEHALRHARIHDQQMGMADITGAIGWCAFDYNTHREFGAGDRICHHGVMDIFRLPKFAACFYESQIAPTVRPVLRAATFWTFGERARAGVDPLIVFSNCEAIEVYKGDELYGRYQPDRETYPHLAYPPFTVPGIDLNAVFGFNYRDLRIIGYLGGVPVVEQRISSDGLPFALTLEADDLTLDATGADMTRLVFKLVDRFGNRQPYTTRVVSFTLEGPGELVGTNPFPLVGGQAAVYVRAGLTPGDIKVRASVSGLDPAEVMITVQ